MFWILATDVNVMDLPSKVGEALGINDFAAGLLLCVIIYFAFTMPLTLIRNKALFYVVSTIVIGGFIAIGWLHTWIGILVILLYVGLLGSNIKRAFS